MNATKKQVSKATKDFNTFAQAVKTDNVKEYSRLYLPCYETLVRYAVGQKGRGLFDAEELAATALERTMKAVKEGKHDESKSNFFTYCINTLKNVVIDSHKQNNEMYGKAGKFHFSLNATNEENDNLNEKYLAVSDDFDIDQTAQKHFEQNIAPKLLDRDKEIIMYISEGYNFEDLPELMGADLNTTKQWVNRLKGRLEKLGISIERTQLGVKKIKKD